MRRSPIDLPEAHEQLLDLARTGEGELRAEAIRMIGIGGNTRALAGLAELYSSGDEDVREAILDAYMIAGDTDAVYQIAANATNPDEFEAAVKKLVAMGAQEELRKSSEI